MKSDGIECVPPLLSANSKGDQSGNVTGIEREPIEQATSSRRLKGNPNDEFLLSEVAAGSKDALGLLFRRYRPLVLNIAHRILRDASEAEDLCQEVFLLLFQKAKLFDASKGTVSSWIIQIAYHRAINRRQYLAFRRHYDAQELHDEHLGVDRCRVVIDEIVARTLLNKIRDQLSPEQRQTLELHFFEGYSLREIADKTGQVLGNVRHHYYRGLNRLRSCVFPEKAI